ncbi:MAG: hypothetical protein V4604_06645 [Bacteroidota bacterium]
MTILLNQWLRFCEKRTTRICPAVIFKDNVRKKMMPIDLKIRIFDLY